jgi:hypothetical protein
MEASAKQIRRSAVLRVLIAVLVPIAIAGAWFLLTLGPLSVHTDVIGYPTFHDYNYKPYFTAYYLEVAFFPIAALALWFGLGRFGPRFGLRPPPDPGPIRPRLRPPAAPSALAAEPPLAGQPENRRLVVSVARIGFVGAILGYEIAVLANSVRPGIAIGIVGYTLASLLLAGLVAPRIGVRWTLPSRIAVINVFGVVGTFVGLFVVSQHTKVNILSDGSTVHYHWLPGWLALPATAALLAVVVVALRRIDIAARAGDLERRMVLLVAAPVGVFLMVSTVPAVLGFIDFFHSGEQLVGASLVQDGWLPWRDVVLTHGIFQDVVYTFGRYTFGNSVWGHAAGVGIYMRPLYLISVFFLFVYLTGRNWLFLLFAGLLLVGPYLSPEQFRMILWPPILLLLATLLRNPLWWKGVGLGGLAVIQTILTPEAAPSLIAIAAVLIAYEWYWREPGSSLSTAFRRTILVGCTGVAAALAFAVFLLTQGALDDYVYTSINLLHGFTLASALPPGPGTDSISNPLFVFLAVSPPVAILISFAYAATRLRLRKVIRTDEWVMAAVVIFLIFYYPKFLSRMDTGHVYQPFVLAFPLIVYIVYRAVDAIETAFRKRRANSPILALTAHPLSLLLVAGTLFLSWGTYHQRIGQAPSFYAPSVPLPANHKKVGYAQTFDGKALADFRQVVDAYLKPKDRFFDFSNTPLLFFYLLDRQPSTRYFHVSLTYAPKLQQDLIRRLAKSRPKLIAFDNDGIPFAGLSAWDGIPNMVRSYEISQWILDHYRPLLWTHGITFYARPDQPPPSKVGLHLTTKPVTKGVAYSVQPCNWGYSPNFLSGAPMPPSGAASVRTRVHPASGRLTVSGWAGDPHAKLPARKVIAVTAGKVIGSVKPSIDRPDLAAYPPTRSFGHAGFRMQVLAPPGAGVRLFGVSRTGKLTQLVSQGQHPIKGSIMLNGHRVPVTPNAVWGQINMKARENALRFSLPAGSHWTDYRWIEVDSGPSGFRPGTFTVYDKANRPSLGREISFQTLTSSPHRYLVRIGSCSQWHAYRERRLFLNSNSRQDVTAVRLIR